LTAAGQDSSDDALGNPAGPAAAGLPRATGLPAIRGARRVVPGPAAALQESESVRGSRRHQLRRRNAAVRREDRPIHAARGVRAAQASGARARLRLRRWPLIAARPSALVLSRAQW